MPDSPEIATPRHFRRILLAGVLLVAVGFGLWRGLLREQVTLVNPLISPVLQKELSASQKAQATAEQLDRVAHDHNASPEERRIAFESIGDAAATRGNFDAAFEAYLSAEALLHAVKEQGAWVELRTKASRMLRKTGQLRAASELFSSVVLNGWLYGLPNREALQLEGEQLYAQLNPSDSKEDKLAIHRRVFTIRESVLGAQHPLLAWDLDEFARTLTEFGKLEEAVGYSRRSLEISLAASGDSWVTFERLETMTSALMSINKIDEAVSYARKAVVIFEKKTGSKDIRLGAHLVQLGKLLQESTNPSEAEPVFRRAMEILLQHSVNGNLYNPHPLHDLAKIYHDANHLKEAEALYQKTTELPDATPSGVSLEKARSLTSLAKIMEDTNRLPEAVPIFRNAAKITLRLLGVSMGPFVNHLEAPGNYLRAARQLGITDEEIYQRLEADLPNRRRVKEQFQELWKVVLEQNPKESADEQPAPLK